MDGPTYDSNGYITSMVPVPTMDGNPWVAMANQGQQNVNSAQNAALTIGDKTNQMNSQTTAMNAYGTQTQAPAAPAAYPAMANSFGLGSTPNYGGDQAPTNASTDRGNPWMLKGDALSR